MKINCCAFSQKGTYSKEKNQDALTIKTALFEQEKIVFAVVCDGVGGLSKGEIASRMFIRGMESWFYEELSDLLEETKTSLDKEPIRNSTSKVRMQSSYEKRVMELVEKRWTELFARLHLEITGYGRLYGIKLGTTAVCLFTIGKRALVMHVGDSRCYKYDAGRITKMTRDHSFAEEYVKRYGRKYSAGDISFDKKRYEGALTQCIGASGEIAPEVIRDTFSKNCVYLLCTDGFWKKNPSGELEKMMRKTKGVYKSLGAPSERKIERVLSSQVGELRGKKERDDISAVLAAYYL